MKRVMPFMIAVRMDVSRLLLLLKKRTVKPKLMFMKPRDDHTASKAASLCCKASRM